jgi:ureidoglycolate lyase
MHRISPLPLTKQAFARFGDVVETDGAAPIEINQGFARRINHLANIDVASGGAAVNISLFDVKPRPLPIAIELMERHPLGTQLFMPLQDKPWLVLVCADPHDVTSYRAFTASGRQGVNYARNVWHHPLLTLSEGERFLVVDRISADNLEEVWLDQPLSLLTA